ncbi:hypothetical protein K2F43_00840 [Clostridium estertheticum]|nr:hypothetical protein [Clostridium estertheticum]MBW9169747.1 hypothetical protein [Clostridium estertheticum]WLC74747.1 hypothetical protein KTC99_18625 [Clostridium estertheticum]
MGRPNGNKNRENFTTTLNRTILKDIRLKALREGRNINDIIEELIVKYLK